MSNSYRLVTICIKYNRITYCYIFAITNNNQSPLPLQNIQQNTIPSPPLYHYDDITNK